MMLQVKRWKLFQDDITTDDYLWITKLKCIVDIKNHTADVPWYGGTHQMHVRRDILIQTTTQKQEDMLQLKYGKNLLLMSMVVGASGTTLIDDYGTIYFDAQ